MFLSIIDGKPNSKASTITTCIPLGIIVQNRWEYVVGRLDIANVSIWASDLFKWPPSSAKIHLPNYTSVLWILGYGSLFNEWWILIPPPNFVVCDIWQWQKGKQFLEMSFPSIPRELVQLYYISCYNHRLSITDISCFTNAMNVKKFNCQY